MASALSYGGDAYTGARWRAGLPPGVYEVRPSPVVRRTVRLDTAAFVGLAERGPVGLPVAIGSWPAFEAAFGAPIDGLLGPLAVKLFFENGGRQCVFVRALDTSKARAARLVLPGFGAAAVMAARSAGAWGNRLVLRTRIDRRVLPLRTALGNAPFADGALLAPVDRAVPGTTLRFAGDAPGVLRHVVDVSRSVGGSCAVTLDPAPAAVPDDAVLAATEALTVQLDIALGDALVESWSDGALHPLHPNYLPAMLARPALVEALAPRDLAADPAAPPGSQFVMPDPLLVEMVLTPSLDLLTAPDGLFFDAGALAGDAMGFDAADTTGRQSFLDALDSLDGWDERNETQPVALVALPDLAHPSNPDDNEPTPDDEADACFGPCIHVAAAPVRSAQPYPLLAADQRADVGAAQAALVAHCETHGRRIALLDLPTGLSSGEIVSWRRSLASPRAALIAPWLRADTADGPTVPPAAVVAGLIARVEQQTGVFASPGAQTLTGIFALADDAGLPTPGFLHDERIDLIRATEKGLQLMGSRTTSLDEDWTHISVRRLVDWVALQLALDLAWAPFEPNDGALWRAMIRTAERRLLALLDAGALAGGTAANSFFVRCDRTTMTLNDLDGGRAIMLVGIAPAVPSEFLTFELVRHGADDPRVEIGG